MRATQVTLAAVVMIASIALAIELVQFNLNLGGLPHMSPSETWQTPNLILSLMLFVAALVAGSVGIALQRPSRAVLAASSVFTAVAVLALWSLHRTLVTMQSSASSGPISWW